MTRYLLGLLHGLILGGLWIGVIVSGSPFFWILAIALSLISLAFWITTLLNDIFPTRIQ